MCACFFRGVDQCDSRETLVKSVKREKEEEEEEEEFEGRKEKEIMIMACLLRGCRRRGARHVASPLGALKARLQKRTKQ